MNFHGHEFFKTVSDSCFSVTFISGSENHKSYDNILWLWGVAFFILFYLLFFNFYSIFGKLQ